MTDKHNEAMIIAVHGGAGELASTDHAAIRSGCEAAARRGWNVLCSAGSALDAVEAAVRALEDDPLFNAGRGSVLRSNGSIQMDAAIMDGAAGRAGAVCGIERIAHPISLARAVLRDGRHVLMMGEAALAMAPDMPRCTNEDLLVPEQLARHRKVYGTVGAVALDGQGKLAAATSTGGTFGACPGRVGDSPLIGCGTLADNQGAASATGLGEAILLAGVCRQAIMALHGQPVEQALRAGLAACEAIWPTAPCGLLLVDKNGHVAAAHNTPAMPVCWIQDGTMSSRLSTHDG